MYTLYFKIAIRYLLKNKLYSFINIFGLAIGIASFILIMMYVNFERSYDTFDGSENVYRVYMDYLEGGNIFKPGDAQSYNMTGPTLKKEFPEVLEYVRFYRLEKTTLKSNEKVLEVGNSCIADPSYFSVFNTKLLKGDVNTALKEPNSIVLTEGLAKIFFGNEDPIGKTIQIFWREPILVKITGVVKDTPQNSHFKIDYLLSYSTMMGWGAIDKREKTLNWNQNMYYTYLKVAPNSNINALTKKIIESDFDGHIDERHNIEPIESIHLHSNKPYESEANGSIMRIKFLTAIAIIILVLSLLNYINLSTTKSLERAKEVGVRKVVGAQKQQLIVQSLLESIILNVLSLVLAIIVTVIILPVYTSFTGKVATFEYSSITNILLVLGSILLGMILAGLYPAILLSNYAPSKALKGKIRTSTNGLHIRKGLIITQFLATIVLLIGTIVITKQISFMKDQPIGSDLNNVLAINGEILTEKTDSILKKNFTVLLDEVKKLSTVENVSLADSYPGYDFHSLSSFMGITYPDGTQDNQKVWYGYEVNPSYFDVMGIEFLRGETFHKNASEHSNDIVVNEKFVKEIGITDPNLAVGKKTKFWGSEWNIIGVIKEYHHFGLKSPAIPIILRYTPTKDFLIVKLNAKSTADYRPIIAQLKNTWSSVFPESTFNYSFVDQKFEAQYEEDNKFGDAFRIFTALAIFIAALGLFGLTSYTCIQRKKEIGIRKVNGASIFKILKMLNVDFIKWVVIAFVIAIPIAWYAMNSWLNNFALKTELSWWIFAMAGILALGITILTVSWQSFMAANGNPIEALKDE
ncbi:ABC transporter permease [Aquimarina sp. 2201CG1-2-11]|uniref:ABC transporter permease n=1 Tax=Aquimarina discodermiae TaxID=3231043 RepID=UPI0034638135